MDPLLLRRYGRKLRLATVLPLGVGTRLYGGTDKWLHGYTDHYSRHLGRHRWERKRLIEIGVGGYESRSAGGSLRVWRDYFPRSTIVGIDIAEKEIHLGSSVHFVHGDQTDADVLANAVRTLGGPPNIVIDDGSHFAGHAQQSFQYLFPLMPSGGVYVIEDLHTSYLSSFGGAIPAPGGTAIEFVRQLIDDVQARDRVFARKSHWTPPPVSVPEVAALHVYPGIVFITKA